MRFAIIVAIAVMAGCNQETLPKTHFEAALNQQIESSRQKLETAKRLKIVKAVSLGEKVVPTVRSHKTLLLVGIELENTSRNAVGSVSGFVSLRDPERPRPYKTLDFSESIPGGIEPGETVTVKISSSSIPYDFQWDHENHHPRDLPNARWYVNLTGGREIEISPPPEKKPSPRGIADSVLENNPLFRMK